MDPKIWNPVLDGVGIILAIGIPLVFLWRRRRERLEKLTRLTAGLGGEAKVGWIGDSYVRLRSAGGEVRVRLLPADLQGADYLEFQHMTPLGFNLSIAKADAASRTLQRWGLFQVVKTGDPGLDDHYVIRGSDPARVTGFIQGPGRREAIDYFLRSGFNLIQARPDGLVAQKTAYQSSDFEPARLRSHLEQLGRLAGKP